MYAVQKALDEDKNGKVTAGNGNIAAFTGVSISPKPNTKRISLVWPLARKINIYFIRKITLATMH